MKKTLLNEWHRENGAKLVDFEGWEMPVHYAPGIIAEHLALDEEQTRKLRVN